MSTGKKHFPTGAVWTRPNGEIIILPIPDKDRVKIPPRPFTSDLSTLQTGTVAFKTVGQLESVATNERAKEGKKGEPTRIPKDTPVIAHSDIETPQRPLKELLYDPGTKEVLPEPSLTPDTYLLTSKAGKATWIQLGTAVQGTTVVQSLPSGNFEDLGGATVTTIKSICPYQMPTGGVVLVKMGTACVTAHLHVKTEDGWMTALQATQRGHGTLLTQHAYPQLIGLYLHGGENVLINTFTSFDKTPTLIEAATRGYRPDLSSEPKLDGFITYPLHEGRVGEHSAAQDKPSYCHMAQRHLTDTPGRPTLSVIPSAPKPPQLESKTATERPQRENRDECRRIATGPPSTFPKEYRMGQRQLEEVTGVESPQTALTIMKSLLKPTPIKLQKPTDEPLPDIYLQTPKGEHVQELEAQWEPNPHARACGDTSGLWGLKPGHYHLKANITATDLCNLAHSDLRSQFYKTCPKKEPNPGLEPPYSLGKDKVIKNQKRSASRRRAFDDSEYAKNVETRPTVTASPSTLSKHQVRPRVTDEIHQVASALAPTYEEIGPAPLRDKDLFYKNGNFQTPLDRAAPHSSAQTQQEASEWEETAEKAR